MLYNEVLNSLVNDILTHMREQSDYSVPALLRYYNERYGNADPTSFRIPTYFLRKPVRADTGVFVKNEDDREELRSQGILLCMPSEWLHTYKDNPPKPKLPKSKPPKPKSKPAPSTSSKENTTPSVLNVLKNTAEKGEPENLKQSMPEKVAPEQCAPKQGVEDQNYVSRKSGRSTKLKGARLSEAIKRGSVVPYVKWCSLQHGKVKKQSCASELPAAASPAKKQKMDSDKNAARLLCSMSTFARPVESSRVLEDSRMNLLYTTAVLPFKP